jgi:hypothetical protein
VRKGFDAEVLTTDPSGKLKKEDIINGVRVKRFRSFAPNDIYHFSTGMLRELRKSKFDKEIK